MIKLWHFQRLRDKTFSTPINTRFIGSITYTNLCVLFRHVTQKCILYVRDVSLEGPVFFKLSYNAFCSYHIFFIHFFSRYFLLEKLAAIFRCENHLVFSVTRSSDNYNYSTVPFNDKIFILLEFAHVLDDSCLQLKVVYEWLLFVLACLED